MTSWTRDELARVGGGGELQLTALRPEGWARRPVTIWTVRVGDGLYVRSWRGASGAGTAPCRPVGRGT